MYEIDEKCQECKNNETAICNRCDMFYDEFDPIDKPPKTNADRVRSMSDEELADWLKSIRYSWRCYPEVGGNRCADFKDDCKACWFDWLKQEAGEEIREPPCIGVHDGSERG